MVLRWKPVILGLLLASPASAVQPGPQVNCSAGGIVMTGSISMSFSAGLPIAGTVSSGGLRETCGFWFPGNAFVSAVLPEDSPVIVVTTIRPCSSNPSSAPRFALEIAGQGAVPARLEIFTVSGRSVSVPLASSLSPGSHQISWNGMDAAGRRMPSGIYLARFTTPEFARTVRVVLVR